MAMKMAATTLLLVLAIVPAALAVTYNVGDASQWKQGVDYTVWLTGKTFRVGDTLKFTYGPTHTVDEVNKASYDNCGGPAITTESDGDTTIDLDKTGTRYFLCSTPGHCLSGMKLAVTVVASSPATPTTPPSTPKTPASPTPPSSTPGTPSTPNSPPAAGTPETPTPASPGSTSPPPPPKNGASKGLVSYVLVGILMVLGYGLWM